MWKDVGTWQCLRAGMGMSWERAAVGMGSLAVVSQRFLIFF